MSRRRKSVISTNLDKKTMARVIERGEFEDYSERFMDDGYHSYKEDAEDIKIEAEITEDVHDGNDFIVANYGQEKEVAYEPKISSLSESATQRHNQQVEESFEKIENAMKKKKGFTVEDMIAKNFQELLRERKEFTFYSSGKRRRTPKSFINLTLKSAVNGFSLINCLIGAGILSLAKSCARMGIIGFLLWLLGTCIYYFCTWKYYNKAIYLTDSATMGEIFSLILGKPFSLVIDLCQALFFFCYMFCYQVIATQYIFGIIQDLTTREQWEVTLDMCYGKPQKTAGIQCAWHYYILIILAVCVNLPLMFPKSIKFLNKITFISVIAASFATFTVFGKTVYFGAQGASSNGTDADKPTFTGKLWPKSAMDFFTVAPFITSNFIIHSAIPPMYAAIKGASKRTKLQTMVNASHITNFLSCILFSIIAVSGHVAFDDVSSNVLNDFVNPNSDSIDWLSIVCRIFMIVNVCLSYPGVCYPVSASMVRYFPKSWKIMRIKGGYYAGLLLRLALWALTTFCSCFMVDIGVVFNVVSSIFSVPILYIGPLTIMMLWPRFEILGDPSRRKLSVIDNIIYNKVIEKDNPFFTEEDVQAALSGKNEVIEDVAIPVTIHERSGSTTPLGSGVATEVNGIEMDQISLDMSKVENGEVVVTPRKNTYNDTIKHLEDELKENGSVSSSGSMSSSSEDGEKKKEKKSDSSEDSDDVIDTHKLAEMKQSSPAVNNEDDKLDVEVDLTDEMVNEIGGIDLMKNRKKRFIKLPDAHVPLWRYIVFGTIMAVIIILCFISIIGTIIDEINK